MNAGKVSQSKNLDEQSWNVGLMTRKECKLTEILKSRVNQNVCSRQREKRRKQEKLMKYISYTWVGVVQEMDFVLYMIVF